MAIYMKYGNIKGDATQAGFEHCINISQFHLVVDRSVTKRPGGHGGNTREAKRAQVNPFTIVKETDSATTELLIATCHTSKPELCTVSFVRTGVDKPFLKYVFYNSLITKIDTAATGERPTETITFDFTEIEMIVHDSDETNDKRGGLHSFPIFSLIESK